MKWINKNTCPGQTDTVWPGPFYRDCLGRRFEKWRCADLPAMLQSFGKECEGCAFLAWIPV